MSSSYAILGATGSTGGALLNVLLQRSNIQIHVYCRSKQKLSKQFPGIEDNKGVKIFAGRLDDTELLTGCLSGTRAAFHAVAVNHNRPGCSVSMETSKLLITAMKELKAKGERLPKLIVLSSSSTEHRFVEQVPKIFEAILYWAFSYVYDDLKEAETFLRSHGDLVSSSFVKPSALSHDTQKGHSISMTISKGPMSFLDLAAGMVEIGDDNDGKYDMQSVTVNPTANNVAFPWMAVGDIFRGVIIHFLPWTYRFMGY